MASEEKCVDAKRVLMILHAFPPMAASGSFRAARFVRNLREFSWESHVLTIRQDSMRDGTLIDLSLSRLLPENVVVDVAPAFRPIDRTLACLKKGAQFMAHPMATSGPRGDADSQSVGKGTVRRLPVISRVRAAFDWLFAVPDVELGWCIPAFWAGLKIVRKRRPSAIFCSSPPHSSLLVACCLGHVTDLPVLLDLRDPWANRPWQGGKMRWRDRVLEQWCVHSAAHVILNTDNALAEFVDRYPEISRERFSHIPNGVDVELLGRSPVEPVVTLQSSADSSVFCHPGEVYGQRCLLPFVRAMHILQASSANIRLVQLGNVVNSSQVQGEAARLGLSEQVVLEGRLPHQEFVSKLVDASFFLVLQPGTGTQIPAKIYELMCYRKPILALTGRGATADLVRRLGLGVVVETADPQQIAAGIAELTERRVEFSESARWDHALQLFDGKTLTAQLARTLDQVVLNDNTQVALESVVARSILE